MEHGSYRPENSEEPMGLTKLNPSREPERPHIVKYRKHITRAVEELMQKLNDVNANNSSGAIEGDVITLRRTMLKSEDVPAGQDNFVVTAHMKVTIHLSSVSGNYPEPRYPEVGPSELGQP
jgi:hypothetical protein